MFYVVKKFPEPHKKHKAQLVPPKAWIDQHIENGAFMTEYK